MAFIYKITNKLTNKCYIGQTSQSVDKRWKQHISKINQNAGCPALRDSISKYGLKNFTFEIIIECEENDKLELEKFYIEKFNSKTPNGYNILDGGQIGGGFIGKAHNSETKDRISNTLKTLWINKSDNEKQDHIDKCIERTKLINISEKMNESEKWQNALKENRVGHKIGNKLSESTKSKISESLKLYYSKKHVN